MATIIEIRDRFIKLASGLGTVIIDTFKNTERGAATYQRIQLGKGEKADGEQIGQYSNGWKDVRERKGLQVDYVDLRFTEKFWNGIKFGDITEERAVFTDIESEKLIKITDKYGDVFGLSPENTTKYAKTNWLKEFIYQIKVLWQK